MAAIESRSSALGTFVMVLLAIAGLFVVDSFLAKTEQRESEAEGGRLFEDGQRLMHAGRGEDAVHQYQAALSISRGNRTYELALANALLEAGMPGNAESTLLDLLQQNSTDADASLIMARVLVKQGRIPEAISYYHRAVYGQWKQDPAGNRARARFELVDLLRRQNSKEELLAELLPLQEEAPADVDTQKRIGRLFLAAAAPARAAEVYRALLRRGAAEDPEVRAGLGEAEFAQGNYRAAETDFLAAVRLRPGDDGDRKRADVSRRILELDPMQRGLGPTERYRRSVKILEMTLDEMDQCAGASAGKAADASTSLDQALQSQTSQQAMDSARKAVKKRLNVSEQSAAFEENLDLAEQLWKMRTQQCQQPVPEADQPLVLVMNKIAQ